MTTKTFKSCKPWTGRTDKGGYGRCKHLGKEVLAHRLAYVEAHGIPLSEIDGICVCHTCDNPPCVNPEHLWLGSRADNSEDMHAKGRGLTSEDNGMAKLTDQAVLEIRRLHTQGSTGVSLARQFGVNSPSISMIVNRKTWKHV